MRADAATLIDAGPLVALLSPSDAHHAACVDAASQLRPPFLTTWAVITEAAWLLRRRPAAVQDLLEMPARGILSIPRIDSADDLQQVRAILRKYQDKPADLADATLVHLANLNNTRAIFTLDRRDFSVYRLSRNRAFRIVP